MASLGSLIQLLVGLVTFPLMLVCSDRYMRSEWGSTPFSLHYPLYMEEQLMSGNQVS